MKPKIEIYTDGACVPNPGTGGWAAVFVAKGQVQHIEGWIENTTNNQMELLAAIKALKRLPKPFSVQLYSDSKYVVDGMNKWIKSWVKGGWVKPKKNKGLWKALYAASKPHDMEWIWVKGHDGNEYNELADNLAMIEILSVGEDKAKAAGLYKENPEPLTAP